MAVLRVLRRLVEDDDILFQILADFIKVSMLEAPAERVSQPYF
ncbi:hypothetical protein AB0O52_10450 [Arthrobacter sp. NPDC080073]